MRGRGTLQTNFSKGVLDDAMSERVDTEHYYRALRRGRNIICNPQGGFRRRDGGSACGVGTTQSAVRRNRPCRFLTAVKLMGKVAGGVA